MEIKILRRVLHAIGGTFGAMLGPPLSLNSGVWGCAFRVEQCVGNSGVFGLVPTDWDRRSTPGMDSQALFTCAFRHATASVVVNGCDLPEMGAEEEHTEDAAEEHTEEHMEGAAEEKVEKDCEGPAKEKPPPRRAVRQAKPIPARTALQAGGVVSVFVDIKIPASP